MRAGSGGYVPFDELGRVTSVTRGPDVDTTTWDRSPGMGGLGKMASTMSFSGVAEGYGYAASGRLKGHVTLAEGVPYAIDYAYDGSSRLESVTYPAVTTGGRVALNIAYDGRDGQIDQLSMTSSAAPVWSREVESDGGEAQQVRLGNGVVELRLFDEKTGTLRHISASPSLWVHLAGRNWRPFGTAPSL
jgi:hypothetical protein